VDAAEDMDDIRAAVGDPKLTYLGFSYGTLLGATYASLFPTHIRALALDGAIDPAIDEATMGADQAAGFEQDLDDFLAWCTASCAFQPRGAPTLRVAFDRLVAGIRAHPLPGSGGRTVGPGEAFVGIIAPLYDRQAWPVLAAELAAAQRGDGAPLLAQNDTYVERHPDGTYDNEEVANAAVNCLDHPTLPVAQLQSLAAATERQSPYFGAPLIWDSITCDSWPVPAVSRPGPLHAPGAPPILVLGSTGDPVTPYVWAQHLAAELGSGVLVTRHGDGHAAYPFSQCVRGIVDAYLVTGAVPSPAAADCSS
jgi:pimeloyl-ACP methyl ester carboxylesterase